MPRVRPVFLLLLGLLVLELAAWALALMCALEIADELRLRREGVEGSARVVELRREGTGRHAVRYALELPGVGTFKRGEYTGREDLWSSIPLGAVPEAEAGRVRVLYLPANPSVNRPAEPVPGVSPLGDPLAALIFLGLPLQVAAALSWSSMVRGLRQARRAARNGPQRS